MIIGNGFLAKLLAPLDNSNLVIFVSGVSDPSCIDPDKFEREETLLNCHIMQNPEKIILYFGTTTPKESPYAKHKRRMEELIQKNAPFWTIIRIGPVMTWDGTGNTFYDFVKRRIMDGQEFKLWTGESRPILTPDQVYKFTEHWLKGSSLNTCVSFDGPWKRTEDIVADLELELGKKANYKVQ